jgi:hypothetical protein
MAIHLKVWEFSGATGEAWLIARWTFFTKNLLEPA